MSYRVPTIDQPAEVISGAEREERRWQWLLVGGGLIALLAVLATILSLSALAASIDDDGASVAATAAPEPATAAGAPTIEDAEGVDFEPFERVDPNLPAVPAGDVKRFDVDVYHHVTQVSAELAPTEVWSYSVNGKEHRGSGYS